MRNKRGISAVVGVTIMVALVIGLTAIIWTIVTGVVEDELEGTKSCFGNFDKVTINNRYTCYNFSNDQFDFSLSVGEVNLTGVVVSLSGPGGVRSLRIDGETSYAYAKNFAGNYDEDLIYPAENEGLTYNINATNPAFGLSRIDAVEIAPIINGEQCDVSDSLFSIEDCRVFI